MSNIVQSYDASNNAVYPVTHLRAVRDSSGTTLESMMQDVREMAVGYYECSTSGSTAAKTITIDSSVSLSTKILCKVKFVEKNKANNATMNINGTGAKALYYNGVRVAANNSWYPNEVVDLYYDGTNYQAKSCADTLEYNVSLHQTHEITEITTTTRTLVFNGDVVSTWESETPVSDSSVEGYTRSETNTGQDVDSTTIDGPNATYNSTTNKTNVVYVTTHTYTHVVNNYTFQEAVNAVPMSYRHGGLKLSFITNSNSSVHSSDNKYVWYRLMTTTWSTVVANWQGVDNELISNSKNLAGSNTIVEETVIRKIKCTLRNGSVGNNSNEDAVTTCLVPTSIFTKFSIITNRPNTTGFHYRYTHTGAVGESGYTGNYTGSIPRVEADYTERKVTENYAIRNSEDSVGFSFSIWEVSDTDNTTLHSLRITDFVGYDVWIEVDCKEVFHKLSKITESVIEDIECDVTIPSIGNGTFNNSGNAYAVRNNSLIRATLGDTVIAKLNKALDSGHYLLYSFGEVDVTDRFTSLGAHNIAQSVDRTFNKYTITNAACVSICVYFMEYDSNGNQVALRAQDIASNAIEVSVFKSGGLYDKVDQVETDIIDLQSDVTELQSDVAELQDHVIGIFDTSSFANGGAYNGSNSYKVRTCAIDIRNRKTEKLELYTNRPVDSGNKYRYEVLFTSSVAAIGKFFAGNKNPNNYVLVDKTNPKYQEVKIGTRVQIPEGSVAVVVGIYEVPDVGSVGDTVLRTTDFQGFDIGVKISVISELQSDVTELQSDVTELQSDVTELQSEISSDAYNRNKSKIVELGSACRQRKSSNTSKDFQLLIITDSHADNTAVKNASIMTNGFHTISAMIHCGDMAGNYMTPNENMTSFITAMNLCEKPWYNVIGNHEAGTYNCVGYAPSKQHMFDVLIQPLITKGFLVSNEYENGKCYYYHDISEHNIRLIVVNEFDGDLALDDTYWETVAYDASATAFAFGATYQTGDVVKMSGGYTDYCFKAKQNVKVGSSVYALNGYEPRYKVRPGERMLSQEQAQWFLDTLASTPANYSVVIAMHNPFSDLAVAQASKKFSQSNINATGAGYSANMVSNDFFADAVAAFINGTTYSPKIVFKEAAAYRNVLNDGSIDYAYQVTKDFSQKNSGVKFMCYLGGHSHRDLVWKHPTYTNQWQITPVCATVEYHQSPNSDIRRSASDGLDYDSITTISFNTGNRAISLVKLGVDVTDTMEARDYELISLN